MSDQAYSGPHFDPRVPCPGCDNDYLHQYEVRVWFRRKEDSDEGVSAVVTGEGVALGGNGMELNPSSRRDGIVIIFSCENCELHPGMNIIQHKGCTLMAWAMNEQGEYVNFDAGE